MAPSLNITSAPAFANASSYGGCCTGCSSLNCSAFVFVSSSPGVGSCYNLSNATLMTVARSGGVIFNSNWIFVGPAPPPALSPSVSPSASPSATVSPSPSVSSAACPSGGVNYQSYAGIGIPPSLTPAGSGVNASSVSGCCTLFSTLGSNACAAVVFLSGPTAPGGYSACYSISNSTLQQLVANNSFTSNPISTIIEAFVPSPSSAPTLSASTSPAANNGTNASTTAAASASPSAGAIAVVLLNMTVSPALSPASYATWNASTYRCAVAQQLFLNNVYTGNTLLASNVVVSTMSNATSGAATAFSGLSGPNSFPLTNCSFLLPGRRMLHGLSAAGAESAAQAPAARRLQTSNGGQTVVSTSVLLPAAVVQGADLANIISPTVAAALTASMKTAWLVAGGFSANTNLTTTFIATCTSNCYATPTPSPGPAASSTNVGAIVGGVIGGLALLALIIFAVMYVLHRRRLAEEDSAMARRERERRVSVKRNKPLGSGSFRKEKQSVASLYDNPLQTDSAREIINAKRASASPLPRQA